MNEQQQLLRELSPRQLEPYIQQYQTSLPNSPYTPNKLNKLHCLAYIVFTSFLYTYDGALIEELFTRDGIGTLITDAHYEEVRIANIHDVGGLINLLRPLEQEGILSIVPRERLESEIEQFAVIERDGMILACAALYPGFLLNQVKLNPLKLPVSLSIRVIVNRIVVAKFCNFGNQSKTTRYSTTVCSHDPYRTLVLEQGFSPASVDDLPNALFDNDISTSCFCYIRLEQNHRA